MRDALRPGIKPERQCPTGPPPIVTKEQLADLHDVETAIERLTASLTERRPQRGPAQDTRQAIDLVLSHLQRHGPTLSGHDIHLPDGTIRLVDRTDNALEGSHHILKRGERRRSGRKILTQDFEQLPEEAPLALNLTHADYVEALCGSADRLPAEFASLDRQGLPQVDPAPDHTDIPDDWTDIEAASLPAVDRRLVRTDGMRHRVMAAAMSRPPRPTHATAP